MIAATNFITHKSNWISTSLRTNLVVFQAAIFQVCGRGALQGRRKEKEKEKERRTIVFERREWSKKRLGEGKKGEEKKRKRKKKKKEKGKSTNNNSQPFLLCSSRI